MSPAELERYLHDHIPLSKAMQVSVREIGSEAAVLAAPLAPNINHRETVFGGSASALAILACWALLHVRLLEAGLSCRLVIQRSTMNYRRSIAGDFTARAVLAEGADWGRFRRLLERRGRARIAATAVVSGEDAAAYFEGEFVALFSTTISRGR
ncbi:MAG TPA: YiiD C-terminal domain-containing protein [Woeseiaceae bacterium]|nr:YiiD C-terminal domain-containing protein [Woeseiaceae bacterium]